MASIHARYASANPAITCCCAPSPGSDWLKASCCCRICAASASRSGAFRLGMAFILLRVQEGVDEADERPPRRDEHDLRYRLPQRRSLVEAGNQVRDGDI